MTKKQIQQFNDRVEQYLISIGAVKVQNGFSSDYKGFCYRILTKGGFMSISCHDADRSEIYSIFVRFEDLDKAKEKLPNLFGQFGAGLSGKWNIHESSEESAMNCLEYRLEKTKAIVPEFTNELEFE